MLEIIKGIPMPETVPTIPLEKMEVGDCVRVNLSDVGQSIKNPDAAVKMKARRKAESLGMTVATKTRLRVMTIWRTA